MSTATLEHDCSSVLLQHSANVFVLVTHYASCALTNAPFFKLTKRTRENVLAKIESEKSLEEVENL